MSIIGLFFPALISVRISHSRNLDLTWQLPNVLVEYGIYVLVNVLLSECIITYGLGMNGVLFDALNSFSFFTKYTIIAIVIAILIPYIEEVIRKYIQISLTVRTYNEKKENHSKNH